MVVGPLIHKVLAIRRRQAHHRETMVVQVVAIPVTTPEAVAVALVLRAVPRTLGSAAALAATASNLQLREQVRISAAVVAVVCTVRAGQRVQAG